MKIGIIGAGNLGGALAKRLSRAGHQLMLSSNDDAASESEARRLGVKAGTVAQTVKFADVVVLAVPWNAVGAALEQAGSLEAKVLWDCTIPANPDYTNLVVGVTTSGAETVAGLARGARVVKSIPPAAQLLASDDPMVDGKPVASFLCGDDPVAKATVASLVEALPSKAVDFGPLSNARFAEPAAMIIVRLAFGLNRGYRIGLSLLEVPE